MFGFPLEEEGERDEILVEEKDHDSEEKEEEVLDEQVCSFLLSGGVGGEAAAV